MKHRPHGLLFVVALLLCMIVSSAAPASATPAAMTGQANQIVIALRPTAGLVALDSANQPTVMRALSARAGVELGYARAMSGNAHVLRLAAPVAIEQAQQIAARLSASPDVLFAEPDYMSHPLTTPNDPLFAQQWDFGPDSAWGIGMQAAWEYTTGDPNLTIAVIDTGIRPEHPDLAGRSVAGLGYDFISDLATANDGNKRDADPTDPGDWTDFGECGSFGSPSTWHGTHVAGTIAAAANNGTGVTGINWQSKLLSLRALGKCGGYDSDVADAIRWAAGLPVPGVPANTHPARVINMSLGGNLPSCPQTYQSAINDAVARGTVVVVAAGNEAQSASDVTPANCSNVITVGATNRKGISTTYSNYGPKVDLSAPGGEQSSENDPNGILSTMNGGSTTPGASTYAFYQGTSMAAPHVAGVVSLMLSLDPTLTPAKVVSLLKANVTPFPNGGCTTGSGNCGAGILNAAKVLSAIQAPPVLASNEPPNGVRGLSYAFQFTVTGAPKPAFTLASGALPPGLQLSASGRLAGVPTELGTWEFTVRASNSVGMPAMHAVQLQVEKRELTYTPMIGKPN